MEDKTYSIFAPWAVQGLDQTTRHRLRIPTDFLERFCYSPDYSDTTVCLLQHEDLKPFRLYFSTREFGLTNRLLLVPFRGENSLYGVLFVTDAQFLNAEEERVREVFKQIQETVQPHFYEYRQKLLDQLDTGPILPPHDLFDITREAVNTAQSDNSRAALLLISLAGIVQTILSTSPEADQYRVQSDILQVLKTITAEVGTIVRTDSENLVLILLGEPSKDIDLMMHQIRNSLQNLFSELDQDTTLVKKIIYYPDDGATPEELLDRLL
ncbi:MAG: hypothetical protein K9L68_06415 [Spirochaetales bacterium]|nr:hypothetical protein [Spirochaetales bacterium]MCF7938216.1 hypothetical protein [Spirochaetales bacterium]